MKDYKRRPIQLSEHAIAIIKIYSRTDYLEDCFESDMSKYQAMKKKDYEEAAKQFIHQLEGSWNGIFMEKLIKEIKKELKKYYRKKNEK